MERASTTGNGLGETWRVPMSAVFEAMGRTPQERTHCR
jgi:hypothetical protein